MMVRIKTKEILTPITPLVPVPSHMINIGAIADFGKAFNKTKKGSSILLAKGDKNNSVAQIMPPLKEIIRLTRASNVVLKT